MGHQRKHMYNELPEPPARQPRRAASHPTSHLEASQRQRRDAHRHLTQLYVWRARSAIGETAIGVERTERAGI